MGDSRVMGWRRISGAMAALVAIVTAGVVGMAPTAHAGPFITVQLMSGLSYKCLDVLGFNASDGATIGQWECNNAINQVWDIDVFESNAYLVISSRFSGKCMDAAQGSTAAGTRIIAYTCARGYNQRFTSEVIGYTGGGDAIVDFHSYMDRNMCLDVLGATNNSGAPLGLWYCNGALNQQFILKAPL